MKHIICILAAFLAVFLSNAQEPTVWADPVPQTLTDTLFDLDNPGAFTGDLYDNHVILLGDSVPGFWLEQRFFVPSQSKVYTFTSAGILWNYVPNFGDIPYNPKSIKGVMLNRTTKKSNTLLFSAIGTSFLAGYCGGQAERFRAVNGVHTDDGDAFHLNRDLSLWGVGGTGILLTASWVTDPDFKWWKPLAHIATSFVAYKVAADFGRGTPNR